MYFFVSAKPCSGIGQRHHRQQAYCLKIAWWRSMCLKIRVSLLRLCFVYRLCQGTARPSAEPSFSNLPWVPACTSVFAQPSLPLLSCCCQRIHIQAAASFFHSHTRARWLQQLSYFIIAFVIKNEFFLFYHYPNPNYPSKAFLYNIRFAVLSVGSGIVVHFEI